MKIFYFLIFFSIFPNFLNATILNFSANNLTNNTKIEYTNYRKFPVSFQINATFDSTPNQIIILRNDHYQEKTYTFYNTSIDSLSYSNKFKVIPGDYTIKISSGSETLSFKFEYMFSQNPIWMVALTALLGASLITAITFIKFLTRLKGE